MHDEDSLEKQRVDFPTAVRRRPAMYVGSTDAKGLRQMFVAVCDNAVEEAMAGFCSRIDVTLHRDGSLSVRDNGRGFPVDADGARKPDFLERAVTRLNPARYTASDAYKVTIGSHGIELCCVAALSEWLEVVTSTGDESRSIRCARGMTANPARVIDLTSAPKRGKVVRWRQDPEIFGCAEYSFERIDGRLRELAYIVPGLSLILTDDRFTPDGSDTSTQGSEPVRRNYQHMRGLIEYVERLNENWDALHYPIDIQDTIELTIINAAFQYTAEDRKTILTYANTAFTEDGTHLTGFERALTRVMNLTARRLNALRESDVDFTGEDVRNGLTAVVSVILLNPECGSATRTVLYNTYVEGIAYSAVFEQLSERLRRQPELARSLIERVRSSRESRRSKSDRVD